MFSSMGQSKCWRLESSVGFNYDTSTVHERSQYERSVYVVHNKFRQALFRIVSVSDLQTFFLGRPTVEALFVRTKSKADQLNVSVVVHKKLLVLCFRGNPYFCNCLIWSFVKRFKRLDCLLVTVQTAELNEYSCIPITAD